MNRLYFALASMLFLVSSYQVNLSSEILSKFVKQMPPHLERAFKAGCFTKSKTGCPSEALKFRQELDRIYN